MDRPLKETVYSPESELLHFGALLRSKSAEEGFSIASLCNDKGRSKAYQVRQVPLAIEKMEQNGERVPKPIFTRQISGKLDGLTHRYVLPSVVTYRYG